MFAMNMSTPVHPSASLSDDERAPSLVPIQGSPDIMQSEGEDDGDEDYSCHKAAASLEPNSFDEDNVPLASIQQKQQGNKGTVKAKANESRQRQISQGMQSVVLVCLLFLFSTTHKTIQQYHFILTNPEQVQRGYGYSSEELPVLARSNLNVSKDLTTGTNQNVLAFWTRVHTAYNKSISKVNKNWKSVPEWKDLPDDCSKGSLKS